MTLYDAAMIGMVALGMIWGAVRGITWQVASLASLVLGYLVAFPLSAQLAPNFPGEPLVARALALLASYAAVSGGVFLAAWLVRSTLRAMKFEAFDRHLGMILGGLEGAILGVVATVFVVSLAPSTRDPILTSPTGRVVSAGLNATQAALPAEIRDHLAPLWSGAQGDSVAERPRPRRRPAVLDTAPESRDAGPARDDDGTTARGPGLQDLIQQGEQRVGRAVVDEFQKQVERAGATNGRDVERR